MVTAAVLSALTSALWPVEYSRIPLTVSHPLDVDGSDMAQRLWDVAGQWSYLLFQVIWMACVVVRLVHAKGDERRQLAWFVYAVTMGAAAMVLGVIVFGSPTLGVLAVPIIPVVAGVAIAKYRLYDIDLVISKTLVVGAMAAIITVGYIGVVIGVGRLVGASTDPGSLLSLVATAMVAVAFEPVRRRVQRGADHLVYGHRPTPYEALARLSSELSLGNPETDLLTGLASTVADGLGAREVTLWVGPVDMLVAMASWPPRQATDSPLTTAPQHLAYLDDEGRTHVRPIVHRGAFRGAITLTKARGEALTASEDRLLRDLVAQAGLLIENAGLGAELQDRLHQIAVQAGELRAAAKRIVAAQYEARQRIERDLHDGAQQRLVTLALDLRSVSDRAASAGHEDLAASIEDARRGLSEALAELREMARGIHPAILTQEGLEAALSFLAERSPVPVQLRVRLDRRLSQEVEATAYFIVAEALTNAARHSGASSIKVEGSIEDGELRVEVIDDGQGGAEGRWASGLQGLADRVATLNGRLSVVSPVGGGTRLRAEIPCG